MAIKMNEQARKTKQLKSNPSALSRMTGKSTQANEQSRQVKQLKTNPQMSSQMQARAAQEAALKAERIRNNKNTLQKAFSQSKLGPKNRRK